MSASKWDDLLVQLKNAEKPKARRKAAQKLADMRDPAVIPALRDAYENDDDEKVKRIAREALARFKGMEARQTRPRTGERLLGALLAILVLTFAASLALHATGILDSDDSDPTAAAVRPLEVTDRKVLVNQTGERIREAQELANTLRNEIKEHNDTGQLDCPITYSPPEEIVLSPDDRATYPDLRLIADTVDATPLKFEIALRLLDNACKNPDEQASGVVKAAQQLDDIDALLTEASRLHQQAIENPMPTVWPTATAGPPTATPTATQPAATAAQPPTQENTAVQPPAGSTPVPAATVATATVAPTPTPQPTATVPLPALDYTTILAEINGRFSQDFLYDLQNPYGTGMLDQWEQSLTETGQTTANYCQLTTWPTPYELSAEQQAALAAPGVADPQLEELLQLQQEAFMQAEQARELYERDCSELALTESAETGKSLVSEALEKIERVRELSEEIANRSSTTQA